MGGKTEKRESRENRKEMEIYVERETSRECYDKKGKEMWGNILGRENREAGNR